MTEQVPRRAVRMATALRVTIPPEPRRWAQILGRLRASGGAPCGHHLHGAPDHSVGIFLCERPEEAALLLSGEGLAVETETVVTVRAENRPGAFAYLVQTLEAEGIRIEYAHAAAAGDALFAWFRTKDNPKAEDVLRGYLLLPDSEDSIATEAGWSIP